MGKSNDIYTESAGKGMKFKCAYGRDNSDYDVPNDRGGKIGGGPTDLSASISGASANQKAK